MTDPTGRGGMSLGVSLIGMQQGGNHWQTGWSEVRESWEMAAGAISGGSVDVSDLQITMLAVDAAYTIGTENASATVGGTSVTFSARCTNVYRREGGGWKLVHHRVDLLPDAAAAFQQALAQAS